MTVYVERDSGDLERLDGCQDLWIKVTDQLPEHEQPCFIKTTESHESIFAHYNAEAKEFESVIPFPYLVKVIENVTSFIPLPKLNFRRVEKEIKPSKF